MVQEHSEIAQRAGEFPLVVRYVREGSDQPLLDVHGLAENRLGLRAPPGTLQRRGQVGEVVAPPLPVLGLLREILRELLQDGQALAKGRLRVLRPTGVYK